MILQLAAESENLKVNHVNLLQRNSGLIINNLIQMIKAKPRRMQLSFPLVVPHASCHTWLLPTRDETRRYITQYFILYIAHVSYAITSISFHIQDTADFKRRILQLFTERPRLAVRVPVPFSRIQISSSSYRIRVASVSVSLNTAVRFGVPPSQGIVSGT